LRSFCIDFDIESCGLHAIIKRVAPPEDEIFQKLLVINDKEMIPQSLQRVMVPVNDSNSLITLIPAGMDYRATEKVNKMMGENPGKVNDNFCEIMSEIENTYNPDYLLIDSRAGISNMAQPAFCHSNAIVIVYRLGIQQQVGVEGLLKWLIYYFSAIDNPKIKLFLLASNIHPASCAEEGLEQFVQNLENIKKQELASAQKYNGDEFFPIIRLDTLFQNEILNEKGSMVLFNHKDSTKNEGIKSILETYRSIVDQIHKTMN
jgi:MinD-like ATPase involved in chromosome partitioning or flagellar assembly